MTDADTQVVERDLEVLQLSEAVHASGVNYIVFRRQLRPRWGVVWRDLALGYAALVATAAAIAQVAAVAPYLLGLTVLPAALCFGLALAFIQLFMHEAAHFNLVPSRMLNDLAANMLIGSWVGSEISGYRLVHWRHHRHLGTILDPERSYFQPLRLRFLVETLTGIAVLRVLRSRASVTNATSGSATNGVLARVAVALVGVVLHGGVAWWLWSRAGGLGVVAWIVGAFSVYPLLGALRQLLEHRAYNASSELDYAVVPHGRCSRIFSGGLVAGVLGGAGFRWHALHHWDPQVSYTNLREVADFLRDCAAAIDKIPVHATYGDVFRRLYRS